MSIDRLSYPQTVQTGRGWTACPQPAVAAITTKETIVYSLGLSNPTAGALDFTMQDGAGTAVLVITVAAKSVQILSPQGGMIFGTGLKICASGAGCFYTLNAESTVT